MSNRLPTWFGISFLVALLSAGIVLSQPPGFGPRGPGGPIGPGGMRDGFGPDRERGIGVPNPGGPQNVDMYECLKCKHQFSSANKPSRCPNCKQLFDFITDETGRKTVSPEKSMRNNYVLGAICVLVVLAAMGGGIFLIVKLIVGASKPRKNRRRRKPIDDFDDDDRPRRPRRFREE